jgi:hypothetical protein
MMTQAEFFAALELDLQLRAVPFARTDLLAFVADVWPLAQENPDVTYWAGEFMASGRGSVTV